MSRILLAWEGGAGRGHIVTLKIMAEALGTGHVYEAALCRMQHAAELKPLCELIFPSAALYASRNRRKAADLTPPATWAEALGDVGFSRPDGLKAKFEWWVEVIKSRRYDLVIGDFAPVSLLAARALGVPSVCVGTGYSVPPAGMEHFPVLRPEHSRLLYDERDLLANVNNLLLEYGVAPLGRFSDVYDATRSMARTIAELDPYTPWRTQPLLPPLNEAAPLPLASGEEIFVYFSTRELEYTQIVDALCQIDLPTRAYLPGVAPELAARLSASGVITEAEPVPMVEIARRSRIMLHAGQHGSLCMAMGMGLPQLAFPQHFEHLFHARRAQDLGVIDIAPFEKQSSREIVEQVRALYVDKARGQRAHQLAVELKPHLYGDIHGLVREQIEPLLA